jgi:hypothetical protein
MDKEFSKDFQQAISDLSKKCFECQKNKTEHDAIAKIVKWVEEFSKEIMGVRG